MIDKEGVLPLDLAKDREGNFFVLFTSKKGNTALHVLDPRNFHIHSLETLVDEADSVWPEGSYFDPRASALSPDACFEFVFDGYGEINCLPSLLFRFD